MLNVFFSPIEIGNTIELRTTFHIPLDSSDRENRKGEFASGRRHFDAEA